MAIRADKFRAALKDVDKKVKAAEQTVVRVGVKAEQHYEDGTPVAYVAAIHEYGAGHIPPRPFFRPTLKKQGKAWVQFIEKGIYESVTGGRDIDVVMEMVGMRAAADIQETISTITSPELKPSTIVARNRKYKSTSPSGRQSVKPLVDTGLLLSSITHWTAKKGSE